MNTILQRLTKLVPNVKSDEFKDYIVISPDSLLIIDKNLELVEWIIEGNNTDGVYMSADNEDDFLDAISFLKKLIILGKNPMEYFSQSITDNVLG